MGNPQQAQEPTMEEILASIRRIIADDDDTSQNAAESELDAQMEAQADAHDNDDVEADEAPADETEMDEAEASSQEDEPEESPPEDDDTDADFASADADVDDAEDTEDDEAVFELSDVVEDEAPAEAQADVQIDDQGEETPELEDDVAFEDLQADEPEPAPPADPVGDVLLSQEAQTSASTAFGALASSMLSYSGGARTLEGIVEDLLRPLLKSWLDENLPPMVEQMVREEIERVARRR